MYYRLLQLYIVDNIILAWVAHVKSFEQIFNYVKSQVINNVLGDGKVSLGKTWSHVPHCRLLISHPKDDKPSIRELVLVKSSRLVRNSTLSINFIGL